MFLLAETFNELSQYISPNTQQSLQSSPGNIMFNHIIYTLTG